MNLRKVHVGYSAVVSDDPITFTEGHLYENLQKKTALRFTTQPRCFFDIFPVINYARVQTNQFAPYCLLETSSQCAELGRDVYTPSARWFLGLCP